MKATITSIELKGPFKFFVFSSSAIKIIKQLKTTNCLESKQRGFWTTFYTMTLWNSEQELLDFARSGAHLQAMKISKNIAKEIRTLTYDTTSLPDWKTAIAMLENGKVIKY